MHDAATLLRPATITPLAAPSGSPLASHPSAHALLALSDVAALFQRAAPSPVAAKLAFYAARVLATPAYVLAALADEAVARARLVEREGEPDGVPPPPLPAEKRVGPRIEELP